MTRRRYIFLNDTLVAPIWDSSTNATSRSVWVPPGSWEDAWDGSTVTGPKTIDVTQPYEKIPMWHKKTGGLTVMTDQPGLRIDDGNWSTLTLEAWPALQTTVRTQRTVHALRTAARTEISMVTDGTSTMRLDISEATDGAERAWVVRLHLRPGERATTVVADGEAVGVAAQEESSSAVIVHHLAPLSVGETHAHFPFGGAGARPPAHSGHIAELRLPSAAHSRSLSVEVTRA
jgi:hypothetical protein